MNTWKIGKFLKVVLSIQLAVLGAIGLSVLGYDIPFLRQILGFIYLTFVPGLLILRILKLHRLGIIETLLYSVGLSIAFVMFLGFFLNMLYPLVGISKPISILPLIATLTIAVAILCVVAYIRESRETITHSQHHSVPWSEILSPPALFLFLLPLLSALGAFYLANFHQDNILLLILIGLVALVAALVAFNRFIPQRLYPLAVVMIAIALLWHISLISQYLPKGDILGEYYFQNLVIANSFWDHTLPFPLTAVLSIVMLAPIYSLILNMDTVWVFKIVYPLFFSLVPLALFQVFRKQTDDRIAFLSVFFFMSFFVFFTEMLALARQQIAGLFFALSILLFLDKGMAATKRGGLLIIFGFSIVVSHPGLSYFYMGYLLLAMFLLFLARNSTLGNVWSRLSDGFSQGSDASVTSLLGRSARTSASISTLNATFVVLIVVFGLTWFMYTASGSPFHQIVHIGNHVYHSLGEFINLETRDPKILLAMGLASPEVASVQREASRILQWLTQLFIMVGVIGLVFNLRKTRFHPVYIAMTLVSALILAMCIILPYFAGFLNMTRIYHITLFFLAPFCILGGITVFKWLLQRMPTTAFRTSSNPIYLNLVVVLVLIPYLLFNTGFVFTVTGDVPSSLALDPDKFSHIITHTQDMIAAEWLSEIANGAVVRGDYHAYLILRYYGFLPENQLEFFTPRSVEANDAEFIFLSRGNIVKDEIWVFSRTRRERIHRPVSLENTILFQHHNKIYDNRGAQVLLSMEG